MRCYGDFKDDRICDLCKGSDILRYNNCINKVKEVRELYNKLQDIKEKCKYKTNCWDEYTPFDGCNKDGKGYGRFADDCKPSLNCKQYYKK